MKLGTRRPSRPARQRKRDGARPAVEDATQALPEGQEQSVVIERLSHEGRGVARDHSGKTLFVDGALPEERVHIRRHRQRKRFDEAHVVARETDSPLRVVPECEHFSSCGGCSLQHLSLEGQRTYKRGVLAEHLEREQVDHPMPGLIAGSGYGYRRRARLGVKVDRQGELLFGFRRAGSDRLFNIHQCPVLTPVLEALLPALRQQLERLADPQQVGHVELIDAQPVVVSIRQIKARPGDEALWREFAGEQGVSLYLNGEPASDGTASSSHYLLKGTRGSSGYALDIGFRPGDFIQVNADINRQLVETVLEWLRPAANDRIMDLFAGVGNFSLPIALSGARVTAIEGSNSMVSRLDDNAQQAGVEIDARAQDLSQPPSFMASDAVVLDPPRDGAQKIAAALASDGPERVIYISCNPATLARDAALLGQGGYRLTQLKLVDMFPQTAHMESVSLFVRDHQ